ncbi:MAG: hypothetical protein COC01_04925 [Bacteroidetes bacterium]|nr:MAG: hypothetical protein COC01_04925 [Bacteroidota bacterium]
MINSKLVQLLKAFSAKDIRKFREFVSSPYFNKNNQLTDLCEFICNTYPKLPEESLEKRATFKALFPGESFKDTKIRNLMSDLLKLLEEFLAIQDFTEEPLNKSLRLLNALNSRNLYKHFDSYTGLVKNIQEKSPHRDGDFFLNQFQLEVSNNLFFEKQQKRVNGTNLQQITDNLDLFYLTNKLKFCCEIFNYKNVVSTEYKVFLLDEILSYLKKHSYEHIPAVHIYYQILMTLTESEDESHFESLKQMLEKNSNKFSAREARDMYAYAQNYCIKKINSGHSNYLNEIFNLYKELLTKEIILEDRLISPWHFKNIVTTALRLEEFDWVENFIRQYQNNLSKEFRENAVNYNIAALHFFRKEYSSALKLLQKVDFTDIYYHLDSKSMLLKTYFELEEHDGLFSLFDTFKIYLRRNKLISDYQKTVYLNLVKYTKKLVKIKTGFPTAKKVKDLNDQIKETKQVADLNWLIKKVEDTEASLTHAVT